MALHWIWLIAFQILFNTVSISAESRKVSFKTEKIQIGSKKIKVEIAQNNEQHQYGLMNRTRLPENEGMLFIFNNDQQLSFWMKNTLIDLSIAYINRSKTIVDIQEMKATNQLMIGEIPSYPSSKPAMYALEMNSGWFKKNKIKIGDKLQFNK